MNPIKYTKEVVKEGKRVRWPKKETFFPILIAVIVICFFTAENTLLHIMLPPLAAL